MPQKRPWNAQTRKYNSNATIPRESQPGVAIWARGGGRLYFRILPDLGTHGIRHLPPPLVSRSWQTRECGGLGAVHGKRGNVGAWGVAFLSRASFGGRSGTGGGGCPRCHLRTLPVCLSAGTICVGRSACSGPPFPGRRLFPDREPGSSRAAVLGGCHGKGQKENHRPVD